MPVEETEIMQAAEKLGQLVAQHASVAKFKVAQKSVADDAEASRLLSDFDRQLESLDRQAQSGMPVTDAQRQQLEALQSRIVSHIKVKALNMAQVDFMDLMRKVSQTWQRPMAEASGMGGAGAPGGGRGAAAPLM
jgi:cell fate (sporulation/competence/biofilm development) regulator YlbF (YheA/YmcA/DUF963 family)